MVLVMTGLYPEGHDKTFAEMTDQEKDRLSHRGRAMKKLYISQSLQKNSK
jgi:inosine/xanthosine triphosphate pyrophosphatase family protein